MSAENELSIPEVPEAKPGDPEDVSWALSTAEAMWARGDHLEGIKWVRKAAEAAADADDDIRALELAKAASDLTTLIARLSRASFGDGPGYAGGAPPEPGAPAAQNYASVQPPLPMSIPPKSPMSAPPPPPAAKSAPPRAKSAPPAARSIPPGPIPLPSRSSSAPPNPPRAPQAPQPPQAPRTSPRPLATSEARQGPQAGLGVLSSRPAPPADSSTKNLRTKRRSRDNLEVTAVGTAIEVPSPTTRSQRRSRLEPDPTVITRLEDLVAAERTNERQKSTAEWDASPTQNMSGDEMDHNIDVGDRATTAFAFPAPPLPSPSKLPPAARPPVVTVHDPAIHTSQAVRVVVWRDASGVHIAPAGTVVSAITIDAMLVALEPSADLTAWLSPRAR